MNFFSINLRTVVLLRNVLNQTQPPYGIRRDQGKEILERTEGVGISYHNSKH